MRPDNVLFCYTRGGVMFPNLTCRIVLYIIQELQCSANITSYNPMQRRMVGRKDWWWDRWTDGQMDQRLDELTVRWTDWQSDGRTDGQKNSWKNCQGMVKWMNWRSDGWSVGRDGRLWITFKTKLLNFWVSTLVQHTGFWTSHKQIDMHDTNGYILASIELQEIIFITNVSNKLYLGKLTRILNSYLQNSNLILLTLT